MYSITGLDRGVYMSVEDVSIRVTYHWECNFGKVIGRTRGYQFRIYNTLEDFFDAIHL